MRRRPLLLAALVLLVGAPAGVQTDVSVAAAATAPVVIDGHGNGHGIGLSQWGAYGYAVDKGWTAAQILDHYYGGTVAATVPLSTSVRVRLQHLDGAQTAVSVESGSLVVQGLTGGPWQSVLVRESATAGVYSVWARSTLQRCPAATGDPVATGWTLVKAAVAGPVDIHTLADSASVTDVTKLLATCEPNGTLRWYRGTIRALNDSAGNNRTLSLVPMEQYLRTVIAMEMSPGWADDGGGRGAQALQAQAVAARSYALAYQWYPYAEMCDMSCQSYFGVAYRLPGAALRQVEYPATDAAVKATAGVVRRVGTTAGAIALTMFSASNGGYSAPGSGPLQPFTALPDAGDATALNPNHTWSVSLTPATIAAKYPAIGTFTGITVLTRNGFGEWGGRVLSLRLTGTAGSATVTGAAFRSAMGLKDTWFHVRDVSSPPAPAADPCKGRVAPAVTGVLTAPVGSRFTAVRATRLIDTTNGTGTVAGALRAGCTLVVTPVVPAGVTSIEVNLTSLYTAVGGAVTAWACGTARPVGPALKTVAGRVVASMTVVRLGANGSFCLYSSTVTHLQVDLFGTYSTTSGLRYQPVPPARLFDSRAGAKPVAGATLSVKVAGTLRVPAGATAASLTVHATAVAANGTVTVYPCTSPRTVVPTLRVSKALDTTNHVQITLNGAGRVCVYVSAPMHVTVDVSGWFGAAATTQYFGVNAIRFVNTGSGVGLVGGFAAGATRAFTIAGIRGVPAAATVKAVLAEVSTWGAPSNGYLTVHACTTPVPGVSMVRMGPYAAATTSVAGMDNASGRWCITASTATQVAVDVVGWYA
jgi:SpoIID/LytB domain protein